MKRAALVSVALLLLAFTTNVPFWGAKTSSPAGTDPAALKPGEFIWAGDAVPSGPVVVVVSITEQRGYVYRNGLRIGVSTVSTGRKGHLTPTGVFTVLQKDADHRSSIYNDAAMPYTERLTWGGIALHAGGLPGYPSSHGCVHLPSAFAHLLFQISPMGMTVVIADDQSAPREVAHPALLAPVNPTGASDEEPSLAGTEDERWEPEKAAEGTVAIVVSVADRRAIVLRNGVEIGRAKLTVDEPERPFGTHALVMLEGTLDKPSAIDPSEPARRWLDVGLTRPAGATERPPLEATRLHLPPAFARELYLILIPGSTALVTDKPVLPETTGVPVGIIDGDPAE